MKCENQAEYLAPWGGKQVKCCEKHAKELANLGNVMGCPIQIAKVLMEDECTMQNAEA